MGDSGKLLQRVPCTLQRQTATRRSSCSPTSTLSVTVKPSKRFNYPRTVVTPEMDNVTLYDKMMPQRVDAFLEGVNVNLMAYGQTGTVRVASALSPPLSPPLTQTPSPPLSLSGQDAHDLWCPGCHEQGWSRSFRRVLSPRIWSLPSRRCVLFSVL